MGDFLSDRLGLGLGSLDSLIRMMAEDAAALTDEGSYLQLLCYYYASDYERLFEAIRSLSYERTPLQHAYLERVSEVVRTEGQPTYHYSFYSGIWVPSGQNELLGSHMGVGATFGLIQRGWQLDGNFGYRFISSKDDYDVMQDGSLRSTHTFSDLFLGVDLSHELIHFAGFELDALGGIGYEGLNAIASRNEEETKWLSTLNLNLGGRLKYYINAFQTIYIGVDTRYNWLDWNNEGGTALSGDAITVMFTLGFYPKPLYKQILEGLHASPMDVLNAH
jgi:hypothetical protein